jgi:hypothetical protein
MNGVNFPESRNYTTSVFDKHAGNVQHLKNIVKGRKADAIKTKALPASAHMVASPKLSRYFYEHAALNRRLDARDLTPAPPPETPPLRRPGVPKGTPPNRITDEQERILTDLLTNTHNAAAARRTFIAAGHGTVSTPTVCKLAKRTGIPLGKLSR